MKRIALLILLLWTPFTGSSWAAENWSLKDVEGQTHQLSTYRGKWVLVNFWATWCPPCVAEVPELTKILLKHHDLVVIGVAEGYRDPQEVLDFVRDKHIDYPIILGNEDTAAEFGGINGTPTSFLYSPTGELTGSHEGILTEADILQMMH